MNLSYLNLFIALIKYGTNLKCLVRECERERMGRGKWHIEIERGQNCLMLLLWCTCCCSRRRRHSCSLDTNSAEMGHKTEDQTSEQMKIAMTATATATASASSLILCASLSVARCLLSQ